jgi:tRNA G18 (ribose-2'-O)-methylase SpoU
MSTCLFFKNNMSKNINSTLILPDIRSAVNVGSIFRTADAVGISQIYLTGITPRPNDKFGRVQKDIAKSALGAETWVPWDYEECLPIILGKLKRRGYTIIAIEQDSRAVDYRKLKNAFPNKKLPDSVAFILGPEVEGLDKKTLAKCDYITYIPMYGKKESLNVAVACGVALFRILDK